MLGEADAVYGSGFLGARDLLTETASQQRNGNIPGALSGDEKSPSGLGAPPLSLGCAGSKLKKSTPA